MGPTSLLRRLAAARIAVVAIFTLASAVRAQPTPLGPETAVDPAPGHYFAAPKIAGHDDGSFGLGWLRLQGDGSRQTLLFRAAGAGGELAAVRAIAPSDDQHDVLRGLQPVEEGYHLLWRRGIGVLSSYQMEVLGADGSRAAPSRAINLDAYQVLLSLRPGGGFVATWLGGPNPRRRINVQLLGSTGAPEGPPIALRVPFASDLVVLHHPDRQFVLLWERRSVGFDRGVQGRRFTAAGQLVGSVFDLVPPPGAGYLNATRSAIGSDGTIAVAWVTFNNLDGTTFVRLRTFAADGTPLGGTVVVPRWRGPFEQSFLHDVAVAPDGRVLLVWAQYPIPGTPAAFARVYSRTAAADGPAFTASSAASATHPSIVLASATWAGDAWLIAWVASSVPANPDSPMQVYVRRFARR